MENYSADSESSPHLLPSDSPEQAIVRAKPRPVWLSTVGYFVISILISLALFFVVLGLLFDESEKDAPWITAGIAASLMFGLTVAAREVVLRRAQTQYLLRRTQFDVPPAQSANAQTRKKFTLEQNASALRLIQKKSDEASASSDAPEKHFETFKICQEYLDLTEKELLTIHVGSPRLPALRSGHERVKTLHKHHVVRWAAEATRGLTREALVRVQMNDRIETAQRALEILNSALQMYPDETQLLESSGAVREFILSIRVSHSVELAERAAFKGHYRRAIDCYGDALFYLSRESVNENESSLMKARLEAEVERLHSLSVQKKRARKKLSPPK